MKRCVPLFAALALLAACNEPKAGEPVVSVDLKGDNGEEIVPVPADETEPTLAASASASACSTARFEEVELTHCVADPAKHTVATALAPRSGDGAGTLAAWTKDKDADSVAFAMNGGMYGDDLRAVGYFVRKGERLRELDRGNGDGNFYLKPNGVFFGTGGTWRILTADRFYSTVKDRPQFGTQSGPMLIIDGKLHPEIAENGPSKAIRNGVGVAEDGKAHFVMSQAPLSFGQLARFFRDELEVANALYLDGGPASNLWDPATGRQDKGRVGPILVVSKKEAS